MVPLAGLDEVLGIGESHRLEKPCQKVLQTRALEAAWCLQMSAWMSRSKAFPSLAEMHLRRIPDMLCRLSCPSTTL